MKTKLVVLLMVLSHSLFAQTNEEISRQIIKEKLEGPLKAINGTWELQYYTAGDKSFYKSKIADYIKESYAATARAAKEPISAEDSIKYYRKLDTLMKNALDISYSFSGRTYSESKNGVYDFGYISFNNDLTEINLFGDKKDRREYTYKIDKVNTTELVLIPINDYGKELGKMFFTKKS